MITNSSKKISGFPTRFVGISFSSFLVKGFYLSVGLSFPSSSFAPLTLRRRRSRQQTRAAVGVYSVRRSFVRSFVNGDEMR